MSPEEVGARLVDLLGEPCEASVSGGGEHARATVDVPAARWAEAVRTARDELGCGFFDWLSAVDELDEGFSVVVHLWSVADRHGVLLRTRVPREAAQVPSVVDLFPGAAWHERETHEMFGIDFPGHPDLKPLLLPPQFEGHPLRKEFVLASRVAKPWPGAKEPGESHAAPARGKRAPMRPPGVPDPNEWGPQAGTQPQAGTSQAGTSQAGTSRAGTSRTERAPREAAGERAARQPGTRRRSEASGDGTDPAPAPADQPGADEDGEN